MPLHREDMSRSARQIIVGGNEYGVSFIVIRDFRDAGQRGTVMRIGLTAFALLLAEATDAMPTVFIAIREQLGLDLKSSKAELDTLVIDHVERPTEN